MMTAAHAFNIISNTESSALRDRLLASSESFPHAIWDSFLSPEAATAVFHELPPQDENWLQVPIFMIKKAFYC
jgi:hypothetical protein